MTVTEDFECNRDVSPIRAIDRPESHRMKSAIPAEYLLSSQWVL